MVKFSALTFLAATVLAGMCSADTILFRDGASNALVTNYAGTSDTTLLSNSDTNSNANFGAYARFLVGSYDRLRRGLLRFDLSSLQGKYSSIQGATLTLRVEAVSGSNTVNVYQIDNANAAWVEGTGGASGTAAVAADGESTWNNLAHANAPGTPTPWTGGVGIGSGGYDPTPVATFAFPTTAGGDITINLPASLIQAWITGANAGLFFKTSTEGSPRTLIQLRSSEWTTGGTDTRPTLEIQFSPIPEPATAIMIGAGMLALARRSRGTADRAM